MFILNTNSRLQKYINLAINAKFNQIYRIFSDIIMYNKIKYAFLCTVM